MRIEYLVDNPSFLATLAAWHHQQWSDLNPGDTLEKRMARMQNHLGRLQIPTTFVALDDQTLLGSACLVTDDMNRHRDLSPWLASVYVHPPHRRRGVGAALVRRVAEEAVTLEVQTLYLYTPDRESFYARLGWSVQEHTSYVHQDVVIMKLPLQSDS